VETRNRIAQELASLSDRALADIGLYRSDISRIALEASHVSKSEPLARALLADLRALFRSRAGTRYASHPAE
jgi:hypothetical protein